LIILIIVGEEYNLWSSYANLNSSYESYIIYLCSVSQKKDPNKISFVTKNVHIVFAPSVRLYTYKLNRCSWNLILWCFAPICRYIPI
jgi:hypothetical protein